jgi:hypothetical protein
VTSGNLHVGPVASAVLTIESQRKAKTSVRLVVKVIPAFFALLFLSCVMETAAAACW